MRSAIDTNVISALLASEPASGLAEQLLLSAGEEGGLVICGPVYSELIAQPGMTAAFMDDFLLKTGIEVEFDLAKKIWETSAAPSAPSHALAKRSIRVHGKRRLRYMEAADRTPQTRRFPDRRQLRFRPQLNA